MKRAKAGFGATPEEKATLSTIYGQQRDVGKENIRQFMAELSGARGMDIATSSPMAREAARASSELESSLGSAQAASEVDFGERARNFAQEMRGFQQGLQQRSLENRLNIGAGFGSQANALGELRGMQKKTTTKGPGGGGGSGLATAGIGAGATIIGAGIMAF